MSASDQLRNLHAEMAPAPWNAGFCGHNYFHDEPDVLEDGWYIAEQETLGDFECGAMREHEAKALAALRNALPLIADAIAAAQLIIERQEWPCGDDLCIAPECRLARALAALDEALSGHKGSPAGSNDALKNG